MHAHLTMEYISATKERTTTEVMRQRASETPEEFKTRMKDAFGYRRLDTDTGFTNYEYWQGSLDSAAYGQGFTVEWCEKVEC